MNDLGRHGLHALYGVFWISNFEFWTSGGRQCKLAAEYPHTVESLNQLVRVYESWNRPEEATKWRAKLPSGENATK